jgi:hypothetical protein
MAEVSFVIRKGRLKKGRNQGRRKKGRQEGK